MKTEEEYTQWHDDGHEMTVEVCIEVNTGMPEGAAARKSTFTQVKVHCPEDSFCHRWAREHAAEHFCFVRNEIDAVGHWDFIEQMDTAELPEDWSSGFPIRLAWRDEGEDGLTWKPTKAALQQFFERTSGASVS